MVYACVRYCAVEFSLRIDHSQCGIDHYFNCENEFDTLYRNDYGDEEVAQISYQQSRICLTRDRGLLKRNIVKRGYCLRSLDSRQQVKEVLRRFDLLGRVKPFRRCEHCNGLLEQVDKNEIIDQLQPKTKRYFNEFRRFSDCGQVYGKGSHYERIVKLIDDLLE